jgi:WASH complex subunit strumpellin
MREIVDKFFADNWVIPFYMGFHVDLQDAWAPYKAASVALGNILGKVNVNEIITKHSAALDVLNSDLDKFLTQGVLIEDFVLTNIRKLMHHSRSCNVCSAAAQQSARPLLCDSI